MSIVKSLLNTILPKGLKGKIYKKFYIKLLRPFVYRGNSVYCPVCNGNFREFMPAGPESIRRTGAECPKCTCKERHRLFWLYLQNQTSFFSKKAKVLHFAPEPFFQAKFLNMKNLDYVSADLFSSLAMLKVDITDIPFKDDQFDVVFCSHVLEHVPEDRKAMSELYRVLKPGGWAILQVPIDTNLEGTLEDPNITTPEERIHFYWNEEHVRLYGCDYKDRLSEAGFQVTVDPYVKTLDEKSVKSYGLLRKEDIFLCMKPNL
ncbi:class I SAM-dependent methyltransferase [Leptothoe spongobia]|uniref:Methyltransferase domain-containing protein n=1 Tax=Leptothoe spongobia TAU-MAC 1115 TaxID=1967444 RepID=A0A947DHV8_9CYAN|nr:class I SAM-dependent methyltransferase [Leptothoe spongobia]MBT9317285.1 methyltransferase domain-containing protein [Leptothoe spongobia TAU-MAC 1115]